ncbi:unnamed protein product [Pieris macdunnoughi]|uniref:Uncharacterized protein n=1 Tax=Pieris macdunnoughi TaxID=345717 RepID=A0A821T005_9NEOP|nr:unnamed protein product [Pieris macdunnoughi]
MRSSRRYDSRRETIHRALVHCKQSRRRRARKFASEAHSSAAEHRLIILMALAGRIGTYGQCVRQVSTVYSKLQSAEHLSALRSCVLRSFKYVNMYVVARSYDVANSSGNDRIKPR